MSVNFKNVSMLTLADTLIIAFITMFTFISFVDNLFKLILIIAWFLAVYSIIFFKKKFYELQPWKLKDFYTFFETIAVASVIISLPLFLTGLNILTFVLLTINTVSIFIVLFAIRLIIQLFPHCYKSTKNVLIVGAGQDGKLIAEEIQSRPELGLKVVGFLDDNMNTIEDEDSTVPVLGLTCDSDAVIKDNNVKLVIIAVKSRMDSGTLTDLVKGIPLGVKVWRMPKFYEKITQKYLVSKMTVNWLFYSCVKKKALLYAYIKRICDIVASILIMIITLPLSLIAMIGIKLSDLGPIFFTQIRIGKFGKPFKMIKFRTMYQATVDENYDEDLTEVELNDKRIMPFCRIIRKFHIDELPQMINVLRGEMSIVGPRPIREEVYYENKNKIPFWETRNWVRPGWCGWQQVKVNSPDAEDRLGYDLYYIKHRHTLWEFGILLQYIIKVITGRCK